MVKKVIWSPNAISDRIEIFDYWFRKTGDKNYSNRINKELLHIISLLKSFPQMGRRVEEIEGTRYFIKSYYRIYYRLGEDQIEILHIWDGRRNPDDLELPTH